MRCQKHSRIASTTAHPRSGLSPGQKPCLQVVLILNNAPVHCHEELANAHPNQPRCTFHTPTQQVCHLTSPSGCNKAFMVHSMRELYSKAHNTYKDTIMRTIGSPSLHELSVIVVHSLGSYQADYYQ